VESSDDIVFNDVPMLVAVKAFLSYMLDPENDPADMANRLVEITCPICLEDPYVSEEKRYHVYNSERLLDGHLKTSFHGRSETLRRQLKQTCPTEQPDGTIKLECPYGCKRTFVRFQPLINHIKKPPNPALFGADHESRKIDDGWYMEDFYPAKSTLTRRKDRRALNSSWEGYEILRDWLGQQPAKALTGLDENGRPQYEPTHGQVWVGQTKPGHYLKGIPASKFLSDGGPVDYGIKIDGMVSDIRDPSRVYDIDPSRIEEGRCFQRFKLFVAEDGKEHGASIHDPYGILH